MMTMPRQMTTILAAATLFAATAVCSAQTANQPGPVNSTVQEQQAAPIERAYPNQNSYQNGQMPQPVGPARVSPVTIAPGEAVSPTRGEAQATPIQGVILRVGPQSKVEEVSSTPEKLELRVDRGLANINVHKPAKDTVILVDLPGGQTQLLKNGLYTFNADTNTARVLKGEALAFPAANPDAKPMKVKEDNKIVFSGTNERPHQFVPYEASVDLLPGPRVAPGEGGGGSGPAFAYGPYGDGFYPYYAYGSPWGWGSPYYYPYGFYPTIGIGFGYYGGFHGGYGGFHGGGFHGGGFHGRR
jgi:hypothetical protein